MLLLLLLVRLLLLLEVEGQERVTEEEGESVVEEEGERVREERVGDDDDFDMLLMIGGEGCGLVPVKGLGWWRCSLMEVIWVVFEGALWPGGRNERGGICIDREK